VLFIGAMLEPDFTDLVVWTAWFSILGFMRIFSLLARDRFEYVRYLLSCSNIDKLTTFNPNTSMSVHGKLLALLVSILLFGMV
jgi:autocrine motility factor receptor